MLNECYFPYWEVKGNKEYFKCQMMKYYVSLVKQISSKDIKQDKHYLSDTRTNICIFGNAKIIAEVFFRLCFFNSFSLAHCNPVV